MVYVHTVLKVAYFKFQEKVLIHALSGPFMHEFKCRMNTKIFMLACLYKIKESRNNNELFSLIVNLKVNLFFRILLFSINNQINAVVL